MSQMLQYDLLYTEKVKLTLYKHYSAGIYIPLTAETVLIFKPSRGFLLLHM